MEYITSGSGEIKKTWFFKKNSKTHGYKFGFQLLI